MERNEINVEISLSVRWSWLTMLGAVAIGAVLAVGAWSAVGLSLDAAKRGDWLTVASLVVGVTFLTVVCYVAYRAMLAWDARQDGGAD